MSRSMSWVAVAILALAGCSEYDVKSDPDANPGPAPDILVEPSSLQFSELTTGDEEVQTFQVTNVGASTH